MTHRYVLLSGRPSEAGARFTTFVVLQLLYISGMVDVNAQIR